MQSSGPTCSLTLDCHHPRPWAFLSEVVLWTVNVPLLCTTSRPPLLNLKTRNSRIAAHLKIYVNHSPISLPLGIMFRYFSKHTMSSIFGSYLSSSAFLPSRLTTPRLLLLCGVPTPFSRHLVNVVYCYVVCYIFIIHHLLQCFIIIYSLHINLCTEL